MLVVDTLLLCGDSIQMDNNGNGRFRPLMACFEKRVGRS
jgi:hypothetical protein